MLSSNVVLKAIIAEKCPRCHRGDLFITSAYNLKGFTRMHANCTVCKQTFEPEPGFYFGAMFVAYGLLVMMSILTWILLYFVFHPTFAAYIATILLLNVLLLPLIFRYSRTLFLFGFGGIKYNEKFSNLNP